MILAMKLVNENVIVTASALNPSVFSPAFLERLGLAQEEQFGPVILTPGLSQLSTGRYEILVTPDRLQFIPKGEDDQAIYFIVREILWPILQALPHTPYKSVGMNFIWHIDGGDPNTTRRLFENPSGIFAGECESPDAKFGAYFSRDMPGGSGARLRATMLPARMNGENVIQSSFNFDKSVAGEIAAIEPMLSYWPTAKEYSHHLAQLIENAR